MLEEIKIFVEKFKRKIKALISQKLRVQINKGKCSKSLCKVEQNQKILPYALYTSKK